MENRARPQTTRIAVRLQRVDQQHIKEAANTRGFASPSSFIRTAIRNELNGRAELTGTEERIAGGIDRVSRDVARIGQEQQALFALVDALAKALLACVPEPSPDAQPLAVARARERYVRLVKSAGQGMSGDAHATMHSLVNHAAE